MTAQVEQLGGDTVRLKVDVPGHDVHHAVEHATSDLAQSVKIPGFRPGKVPVPILTQRLGKERIMAEAVDSHIGGWFWNAAARARIRPVAQPQYDYELPTAEDADWQFTATVPVQPKVDVVDWTQLEVGRPDADVPEELVVQELDTLRESVAELVPAGGRPAREGDTLVVDIVSPDGEAQRDTVVELGSGRLVEEVEAALVGASAGETKSVAYELADEDVDGGGAERGVDLVLELRAETALDVGAQLGDRVEFARRLRQVVVDRRQHLLLQLLQRHRDGAARLVGQLVGHLAGLARREPDDRALDLLDEPAGAELDDGVALTLAVRRDQVDHGRVALTGGPAVGRDELGDVAAQRLDGLVDRLLGHVDLDLRHLERRPVDERRLRLHLDGGVERPLLVVRGRQLVLVARLRDRPEARARRGAPEPAADVALDRLGVDALAAEPRDEDGPRHLPRTEAGHLDALREIGERVLDGVVHGRGGNVDGEPYTVVAQLLDRRH